MPAASMVAQLRRLRPPGVVVVVLVDSRDLEPPQVDLRLRLGAGGSLEIEAPGSEPPAAAEGRADLPGVPVAESLARRLAPLRMSPDTGRRAAADEVGLLQLLGLGDAARIDPAAVWRQRPLRDVLRPGVL